MAGDAHLKHLKLNPPPVLKLKGDVRANFEKWQKLYQNYVKTAKLNVLPDEERIDILFNLAGEDVILVQDKILEALSENHQKKYDKVYKELEFYCRNLYEYNEVYERFALHTRTQKPGEPFQTFYEDLCEKAATCNFESKLEREKQIRDCIVKGVTDEELRTVLLEMRNLTLEFAVQKCRSAERVAQQSTAMQRARPEVMAVNAVDSGTKTAQSPASSNGKQGDKGSKRRTSNFTRKCGRCDTLHDYKKCPAYGHTCEKCKSRNHLEAVCRAVIPSAPINPTAPPFKPAVNELQVIDNGLEENFYVDSVASSAGHSRSGWWVTLPLQDMELDFKLDPGADVNILPLKAVLDRGCQEKIRSANVYLKVYDPFNNIPPIKCLGYVTLYIMVNNVLHSIEFVVSEGDATPIIGAKSCLQLGLVKLLHDVHMTAVQTESYDIKSKFIADNNDVFSGIGHFPGQYSFVIEPGAKLKNSPPHRIPFAVRDRLKLLLDKHEASGIVKKVDVISPDMMISNLVITEKPNGDIRVCLDPWSDRLKRLRLKLQKYDIDLIYQPGPLMYVADQLSRSYLDETEPEDPQMIEVIHSVTANCPVTKTNLECIREATAKDITLSCVIKYVQDGWPAQISKIPVDVRPYWSHKVSLHVENGILLLDSRIVVPLALRSIMLEKLHAGHSGVPKTVSRAQQSLYWPNYRTDIANFVDSCETCNKFARRKSPAELLQHEIPNQPWQAIGVDIAEYGGVSYLVVADLFSKWLIIEPLKDKSTCSVIDVFLTIFADHGFPETLYCDNNPLDSYEFKVFAKGRFSVVTSSPTYAKSNGFAEKYVGIAKDILKKSCHLNVNFRILLREYRATPLSNLNVSPAQIHLSRQIKTDVPVLPELLKPKLIHQEVHEKMIAFQAQVKVAHDKRVMRPVKTFQPGDVVNVRSRIDSTWEPGTVVGVCDKPRSYFVRNNRGRVVRRNESHMSLKVPRNKPGPIQDVITDLVHDDEPDVSEPQYVLQMPFDADDQEIDPFDIPAYIFDL
ncbi:hypothetical protein KUF71_020715 [Frankliniella fusca]|uniref:RNA-directed DNA polymerase n=1 Tax=Frankliniella fusca TaxID=407009 RepID=A0AAE1GYE6_9NEOP|nr:hypothetical protein KUF71_020715 [Frankliniella fusca]